MRVRVWETVRRATCATSTLLVISGCASSRGVAPIDSMPVPPIGVRVLAVVVQPSSSAASGSALARQPVVQVRDATNAAVHESGVAVSASIASGGGTVTGTTTAITDATGTATFTDLAITGSGAQTLRFTATGLTSVVSSAITLTPATGGDTTPAAVMLVSEGFDDASLAARGWYDLPAGGIQSISTAEHNAGAGSLQISFPAGATTAVPPVVARHQFAATPSVYVRYWVKHSANWVGSGHPYHPHEFYIVTTEDDAYVGPSVTHLTLYVEENVRADGGYGALQAQDSKNIDSAHIKQDLTNVTEARAVSGCNGNPDGTPTDCYFGGGIWNNDKVWFSSRPVFLDAQGSGYKGDWHKVEAFFRLNSIANGIGQRDGVAQYWVDGALVIDRHDLMFRTGLHPTMQFNQFLIGPYIGDGSPVTQSLWIDDLVIMTARPAP